MATERQYQQLINQIAALRRTLAEQLAGQLALNPQLAEAINQQLEALLANALAAYQAVPVPPDRGLAALIGLGPEASDELGDTRHPLQVSRYEEAISAERINAIADLYYIYQHEKIGVFRAIQKLKELFNAGTVKLSSGPGAYALYQFDRREVLRYTRRERLAAYRRAFGYGGAPLPPGSRANGEFHTYFTHFVNQVTLFWRDKRISDVIRSGAQDPSFGSIAFVRQSGLDLRHNLKTASYGHLNVMRVETMQLLDEAFAILGSDDILRLFGADDAWDAIEEVLNRYLAETPVTSPRQRMALTGRTILQWLGQRDILQANRASFEAQLYVIAEDAEEWLTAAQALGLAQRRSGGRVLPLERTRREPAQLAN